MERMFLLYVCCVGEGCPGNLRDDGVVMFPFCKECLLWRDVEGVKHNNSYMFYITTFAIHFVSLLLLLYSHYLSRALLRS